VFAFLLTRPTVLGAQTPAAVPQQAAAPSGTSTDLFLMPGSDFDRF